MPDPTDTSAVEAADEAVELAIAAVDAGAAIASGVLATVLSNDLLDPLNHQPGEFDAPEDAIEFEAVHIGPECIFVLGPNAGEAARYGLSTATVREMLGLLDYDVVDAVTIFNYRPEHTINEHAMGLRRSTFRSSRSAAAAGLPEHEEDTAAARTSQPWFYDLLDYLVDRADLFEKGFVGSVGLIHMMGHADFNGMYLKQDWGTLSTDLNPADLPARILTNLDRIRAQLHVQCHVKLWGCAEYYLGQYYWNLADKYPADVALFTGLRDAPQRFRSMLEVSIKTKGSDRFIRWYRDQVDEADLDPGDRTTTIQIIGNNVYDIGFRLDPSTRPYRYPTYPAVAIGDLFERPVISGPWGVESQKRTVAASERVSNPSTPFEGLRTRKWISSRGEIELLSPRPSLVTELSELHALFALSFTRPESSTLPSHVFVAGATNPSDAYVVYDPTLVAGAVLPAASPFPQADPFPTITEARAIVGTYFDTEP